MPTKVLLVNTLEQTVKEAQEMTPPGFDLAVGAPGSAGYAAALADTEYLIGNVNPMDNAFFRVPVPSKLQAGARNKRRLRPRRSRGGAQRWRAGGQ